MSWSADRASWPIRDPSKRICAALRTDGHLADVTVRANEVCPCGHIVRGRVAVECPLLHRAVNLSQIVNASVGRRRCPSPYKLSHTPRRRNENSKGRNRENDLPFG